VAGFVSTSTKYPMKTPKAPPASFSGARLVSRPTTLLLALGIHLAGFTANASAAPGDLDPNFGADGHVVFEVSGYGWWDHVVALPNGDFLVAGVTGSLPTSQHIIRLSPTGEWVPSFGNQGQVTLNLGSLPGGANDNGRINELIALPGGRILAVVTQSYTLNSIFRTRISLVRLQSNGTLDATFGGDGTVEIDTLGSDIGSVSGAGLDSEGRIILVCGTTIVRLTPEGYLDSSFSGDGIAKPYVLPNFNVNTIAIQADDKILIAGSTNSGVINDYNDNLVVCRVLPDGNLDPSFASSGKLVMDLHGGPDAAKAICIRPNGKIVVGGVTRTQPGNNDDHDNSLFVGLIQNGVLDPSFGSGGVAEIQASGLMDEATAAALMPDGRIVASCTAVFGGEFQFAALRLMPDGTPDPTLAVGGIVQIPNPDSAGGGFTHDIARDRSGGILVLGSSNRGILVRLTGDPDTDGDGVVDASETGSGIYVSPFDTGTNPNNRDTDGDGLSDGEEAYQYLTQPLVSDSDSDGFVDGYEVLTGKSPTDPLDKPALIAEARTAIEFTFPSALGKTYRIEDSLDMTGWSPVETGIAGNGGVITRFYTTRNQQKRFFRVEEGVTP
jgi:uncharacterized delta-60 repeat protein